jgi:hypothetical protein
MKNSFRVLRALVSGPKSAGEIGVVIWPNRTGRITAVQGGGDYAAQMLLGRLRKDGLVRTQHSEGSSIWELTEKGWTEVRKMK